MHTGISENALSSREKVVLEVPYYDQGDTKWCLYYCLSMMFNYNNCHVQAWEIADHFNSDFYSTYSNQYHPFERSLKNYAEENCSISIKKTVWGYNLGNFDVNSFNDMIKDELEKGQPVLMAFQYELSEGNKDGHAILAVGYDEEHIYLTDPSGAITSDLFGKGDNCIAVPVKWSHFNEKLVSNITPANLAYTIKILEDAPDSYPEGSIYMTDRIDNDFSCLSFTNRSNPLDIGFLHFDGTEDTGYHIIKKGDIGTERQPSRKDSMSVYFSVSNPTSEQKEYTIQSKVMNENTEEVIENLVFETSIELMPYNKISNGVNYLNQLGTVPPDDYRIVLTLMDEKDNMVDTISITTHIS